MLENQSRIGFPVYFDGQYHMLKKQKHKSDPLSASFEDEFESEQDPEIKTMFEQPLIDFERTHKEIIVLKLRDLKSRIQKLAYSATLGVKQPDHKILKIEIDRFKKVARSLYEQEMVIKDKKITDIAKDESKLMWAISEYDRKGSKKTEGVSPP